MGQRGIFGNGTQPAMTLSEYQRSINEEWFASTTAFVAKALVSPVEFPDHFPDSVTARGILLVCHFQLAVVPVCPTCKCCGRLHARRRDGRAPCFRWHCPNSGRRDGHIDQDIAGIGIFSNVTVHIWAALLHLIVMLRGGMRWCNMETEIMDGFDIRDKHTLREWRGSYQTCLHDAQKLSGAYPIGGPNVVAVF